MLINQYSNKAHCQKIFTIIHKYNQNDNEIPFYIVYDYCATFSSLNELVVISTQNALVIRNKIDCYTLR